VSLPPDIDAELDLLLGQHRELMAPASSLDDVCARLESLTRLVARLVEVEPAPVLVDLSRLDQRMGELAGIMSMVLLELGRLQSTVAAPRVRTVERDRFGNIIASHEHLENT
jgi:hypothetical protein